MTDRFRCAEISLDKNNFDQSQKTIFEYLKKHSTGNEEKVVGVDDVRSLIRVDRQQVTIILKSLESIGAIRLFESGKKRIRINNILILRDDLHPKSTNTIEVKDLTPVPALVMQQQDNRDIGKEQTPNSSPVNDNSGNSDKKEEKTKKMTSKTEEWHQVSFIDYPNIFGNLPELGIDLIRGNWFALRGLLTQYRSPITAFDKQALIFLKKDNDIQYRRTIRERMEAAGFDLISPKEEKIDVDHLILQNILAIGKSDKNMVLNLATGDGFACSALYTLRKAMKYDGLNLHVRIFSWKSRLNASYHDIADNIIYFDNVIRFFDFFAHDKNPPFDLEECFLTKKENENQVLNLQHA